MVRARWATSYVLVLGLLTGCSSPGDVASERVAADPYQATDEVDATTVRVDGRALLLVAEDGSEQVVALLDGPEDGNPLQASIRPDGHGEVTVLALTRVDDPEHGRRYELRYLTVRDDEPTDLYWFPWRLQVDETLAAVDDTPPLPVWSPDGGALAWVEWNEDGTVLRTVGWRSDDTVSNPSDDAERFELDGVPPGAQLERWGEADDGSPLLHATRGDARWEIRVDRRAGMAAAMPLA